MLRRKSNLKNCHFWRKNTKYWHGKKGKACKSWSIESVNFVKWKLFFCSNWQCANTFCKKRPSFEVAYAPLKTVQKKYPRAFESFPSRLLSLFFEKQICVASLSRRSRWLAAGSVCLFVYLSVYRFVLQLSPWFLALANNWVSQRVRKGTRHGCTNLFWQRERRWKKNPQQSVYFFHLLGSRQPSSTFNSPLSWELLNSGHKCCAKTVKITRRSRSQLVSFRLWYILRTSNCYVL